MPCRDSAHRFSRSRADVVADGLGLAGDGRGVPLVAAWPGDLRAGLGRQGGPPFPGPLQVGAGPGGGRQRGVEAAPLGGLPHASPGLAESLPDAGLGDQPGVGRGVAGLRAFVDQVGDQPGLAVDVAGDVGVVAQLGAHLVRAGELAAGLDAPHRRVHLPVPGAGEITAVHVAERVAVGGGVVQHRAQQGLFGADRVVVAAHRGPPAYAPPAVAAAVL